MGILLLLDEEQLSGGVLNHLRDSWTTPSGENGYSFFLVEFKFFAFVTRRHFGRNLRQFLLLDFVFNASLERLSTKQLQ